MVVTDGLEELDVNRHYSFATLMQYQKQDIIEYAHSMEEKYCEALDYIDKLLERNEIKTKDKDSWEMHDEKHFRRFK